MRKTLLATAVTALILATGVASADEITANIELEVSVDPSCAMTVTEHIQSSIGGAYVGDDGEGEGSYIAMQSTGHGYGQVTVVCNAGLPYTLETNAGPQGAISLLGDNTGESIPAVMKIGPVGVPFGSAVNGEAFASIGSGVTQNHQLQVFFNTDYSNNFFPIPAADTYRTNEAVILTF
jgi:spore coat protein U-like protein